MTVKEVKNGVLLCDVSCFDSALTLDCGQAFRWERTPLGMHGIAFGQALTVSQEGNNVLLSGADIESFEKIWRKYFDLDRDYGALCRRFSSDAALKTAVTQYPGIRILRQEPWEALCSFIISQNNNIPRIKGIVSRLCEAFGEPIGNGDYSFPSAERLASLNVEDLSVLRSGFRAKYIIDAAKKVSDGTVKLSSLSDSDIDEARTSLMQIKGVGPKVAECTLLYGCGRTDAFPVDVWVKRIMSELYPDGLPECTREYEGIAQQYLFHWRRNLTDDMSGKSA